jgi:hypothetical protein
MDPMVKHLDGMAKEIKDILTYFMLNHSCIEARKPYDEIWCMSPEGDRYYEDMDARGTKLQGFLREEYGLFYSTLLSMVVGSPEEIMTRLAKANTVVTRTIEHKLTFAESSKQGLGWALEAIDEQLKILHEAIPDED